MSERALRFGIRDGEQRAATWKLWVETVGGGSEVYLACRALGGKLKASLHWRGHWHIAYSPETFDAQVRGAIPRQHDRFLDQWPRPAPIAPGVTLAFRIVTAWSAATLPISRSDRDRITWLPNAPQGRATEIDVLFTAASTGVARSSWPGRWSMGTALIGALPLDIGETVWAIHWVVDMPNLSPPPQATGTFYTGRSRADLHGTNLRALVFGTEADGSRVMYDCAAEPSGGAAATGQREHQGGGRGPSGGQAQEEGGR